MENKLNALELHRFALILIYIAGFIISIVILNIAKDESVNNYSLLYLLSSGAILATFGSAITSIGQANTQKFFNRIITNVDILYKDIVEEEKWRRWPFLPRFSEKKLFNEEILQSELQNPVINLLAGSHSYAITIPTVFEDLFDIPIFKNLLPLIKFSKASRTAYHNLPEDYKDPVHATNRIDSYMLYECTKDIWVSAFKHRLFNYIFHFGIALTISSTLVTTAYILL